MTVSVVKFCWVIVNSLNSSYERGRGALVKVEVAGLTYTVTAFPISENKPAWPMNSNTLAPISSTRIEVGCSYLSAIRDFHISHSAPYLPPKILHNLCFSFLLGITAVPREIENNTYVKFWGANMVHYGKCKSDVLTIFMETIMHLVLPPPPPKKEVA